MSPPTRPPHDAANEPGTVQREDPPPFGGTWRRLYTAVLLELVLLIVLFYVFTRFFS